MPSYYVLEFPDWVNVLPITADGHAILLRQYRHGSEKVHIEVPGGSMEPQSSETPQEAAARELIEETGFQSDRWVSLGHHFPNPALQNNKVHTYLALDSKKVAEPSLDPYEDLETFEVGIKELEGFIDNGDVDHTIMIASLTMALGYLKKNGH